MIDRSTARKKIIAALFEAETHNGEHAPQFNYRALHNLLCDKGASWKENAAVERLLFEILHDLYREGLIVSGTGKVESQEALRWPWYRFTEHGRCVVENEQADIYDPDAYVQRLKDAIPTVDDIIVRYIGEASRCFAQRLDLSAAVMLGGASEKAVLLLCESFCAAVADSNARAKLEKQLDTWVISKKYSVLWSNLRALIGPGKPTALPGELSQGLENIVDGVFHMIRTVRNSAGHPDTGAVDRSSVLAGLVVFPTYCRRIYDMLDFFASNHVQL